MITIFVREGSVVEINWKTSTDTCDELFGYRDLNPTQNQQ